MNSSTFSARCVPASACHRICAGTLALAHTSDGRDWIQGIVPGYAGSEHYRDVSHAVADERVVSAPGSAPGTFALAFLHALYPDKAGQFDQIRQFMAREFQDSATT